MVTPADEQDHAQVGKLTEKVQQATNQSLEMVVCQSGYTGEAAGKQAEEHGISLEVVK